MTGIRSRSFLGDFGLANPIYAGATVSVYAVNPATQARTGTLVPLYTDPVGTGQSGNPQDLDSEGKWVLPVYVDQPVIIVVGSGTLPSHQTGVLQPQGRWTDNWGPGLAYFIEDVTRNGVAGSATNNLYLCLVAHTAGSSFANDLAAGKWAIYVDVQAIVDEIIALPVSSTLAIDAGHY